MVHVGDECRFSEELGRSKKKDRHVLDTDYGQTTLRDDKRALDDAVKCGLLAYGSRPSTSWKRLRVYDTRYVHFVCTVYKSTGYCVVSIFSGNFIPFCSRT